jgi:hypothetical protein
MVSICCENLFLLPYGAPWYGKEIINYPDSTVILNRFNESMVFPLNPDKAWVFYKNSTYTIWAQVTKTVAIEVLETVDSVRVIKMWLNDNSNSILEEIQISKNFGFVSTFNLSMFPNYVGDGGYEYDYNFNASLVGIEKLNIGIQNLKTVDIFDFNIGDELHISDYSWDGSPNDANYYSEIEKIIEVNNDDEFLYQTVQRCNKNGTDTIVLKIENKTFLDSLPFVPYMDNNYSIKMVFMIDDDLGLLKYFPKEFFNGGDSCYQIVHWDKKSAEIATSLPMWGYYINRLGGPYHYFSGAESISYSELVYYKKGDLQWGTPYNCDDLLISIDTENKFDFKLYPNPATNQITVESSNLTEPAEIQIIDMFGKICLKTQLAEPLQEININQLTQGIYLYQIKLPGGDVKIGKMIKN